MAEIVQQVAMKGVVVRDGKVLLLREAATYGDGTNKGRYHMPGGRIEPGENFEAALRREVREETGLEIDIHEPIYIGEWRPVIRGVPHQIVAMFMVCTSRVGEVVLSTEHDEYRWVTPDKWRDELGEVVMDPEDEVLDLYVNREGLVK